MSRKEKISEPPPAIEKIISVVRLLDPDYELKSFSRLYLDKLSRDPEGWFLELKKDFGIEEAVDEDGDEDEAEIEYILDSAARKEYEKERERVAERYEIAVLKECLVDMPAEFVAYVHLPDPSLESLYETFISMLPTGNTSFKEFVLMLNFDLIENLNGYSLLLAKKAL